MRKSLRYIFYMIGILLILGIVAFFVWFYNPHEHELRLDASKVFSQQEDYLITNAHIIDVESGEVMESRNLIIQEGYITHILEGNVPDSLSRNLTNVDAGGKYLMPGLYDMHAHLNSGGLVPPDEAVRKSALEQMMRYGVTTIFTLGGHGFPEEETLALKAQQENNEIVSPEIYATGDILTVPEGYPIPYVPDMLGKDLEEIDLEETGILTITESSDLESIISGKKRKGLNGVKIMVESGLGGGPSTPRISNEMVREIVSIAHRHELPVFAHVSTYTDLKDAIAAGVDVIVHTVADKVLDDTRELLQQMREDSIYYTPTLSIAFMRRQADDPVMLDDPFLMVNSSRRTTRSLENWPIRKLVAGSLGENSKTFVDSMSANMELMHEAGVTIMMGDDAGNLSVVPGYNAHLEMQYMTEAGMTPAEVLRSATIVPARFLGLADKEGSIAEGKKATFLLLDKNPLEDIKNTRSLNRIMYKGFWIE